MKFAKTSAIALAVSAMLAGPVLAQGASSDSKIRGGAQGKSQMQGAPSTSEDEELNAQPGATGRTPASGVPAVIEPLDDVIRRHIEHALAACKGRIDGPFGAASKLAINPHTLRARMRKLGINWRRHRRA